MFFLLRMAFWLGLVLVLLPREKTPESEKLPQVGASEAVSAATAAVSDMGQFCKRQPAACEVGGQAATVIGAPCDTLTPDDLQAEWRMPAPASAD